MARDTPIDEDRDMGATIAQHIICTNAKPILERVAELFNPEDVFDESALEDWAKDHNFDACAEPGDLFSESKLSEWAQDHGFFERGDTP